MASLNQTRVDILLNLFRKTSRGEVNWKFYQSDNSAQAKIPGGMEVHIDKKPPLGFKVWLFKGDDELDSFMNTELTDVDVTGSGFSSARELVTGIYNGVKDEETRKGIQAVLDALKD